MFMFGSGTASSEKCESIGLCLRDVLQGVQALASCPGVPCNDGGCLLSRWWRRSSRILPCQLAV